jgi:hypothetical protein
MNAPSSPLRMITQPAPPRPTPKSINFWHACSINGFVGGSGSERSLRASSAFGLYDQAKKKKRCGSKCAFFEQSRVGRMGPRDSGHLSTEMNGRTPRSAGSSSGTHLSYTSNKRFGRHNNGISGLIVTPIHSIVVTYWDGFVYGQRGPTFVLGDLRHDNGSAGRRADEMQRRRTREWGICQVTRCYAYPRSEILEA